jgi:hypothetical protein
MIQAVTMVWNFSRAKGGPLIVALALADYANKNGIAYPSVATLAKKTRLCRRQVVRAVRALVRLGELEVRRHQGPHRVHLYKVTICHRGNLSPATTEADGGDIFSETRVSQMSPNPSGTGKEPSLLAKDLFSPFWENYPSRKGVKQHRQKAEKAFLKLTTAEQEQVTSAASRYRRHCESTPSYAVDAHRFINEGLWRDYWQPQPSKPPPIPRSEPQSNPTLTEEQIKKVAAFRRKHGLSFSPPEEEFGGAADTNHEETHGSDEQIPETTMS